ncbi:uncharacterized protein C20orf96 homolog isoform X2 [Polypterus senegalus]|nr:uncharacterized protein C20orf96 homolog isoform X2 [Polypterus senegalus]
MESSSSNFMLSLRRDLAAVNYSQWEHRSKRHQEKKYLGTRAKLPPLQRPPMIDSSRASSRTPLPSRSDSTRPNTSSALRSACSSRCHHLDSLNEDNNGPLERNDDAVNILKILTKTRRQAVLEYETHCATLQSSNRQLMEWIENMEQDSAKKARKEILQHSKLGNSISALKCWTQRQRESAIADMESKAATTKEDLKVLEERLRALNANILEAREELHTLQTYEESQRPEKTQRILDLEEDVAQQRRAQQKEEQGIEMVAEADVAKLDESSQKEQKQLLALIAKTKISSMPREVTQMALMNSSMKRQIDIYKHITRALELENDELEKAVAMLLQSRVDPRQEIFSDIPLRITKYVMHSGHGCCTGHSHRRTASHLTWLSSYHGLRTLIVSKEMDKSGFWVRTSDKRVPCAVFIRPKCRGYEVKTNGRAP